MGPYGEIAYELMGDPNAQSHFSVDEISGKVRTIANLDAVDQEYLPFQLLVVARDNPTDSDNSKTQKTLLVVSTANH